MVQRLVDADMLDAALVSPSEVRQAQLRKLVVNSVINPLTALLGCKNGQVLASKEGRDLMDLLLKEAGPIVRALLPDPSNETVRRAFSDEALRDLVVAVAGQTAENTSSMLQDVRAGRKTEIAYINGYLVSEGKRLGLPCDHHAGLVERIVARSPGPGSD